MNELKDRKKIIKDLLNNTDSEFTDEELIRQLTNTKITTKEYNIDERSYEIRKILKKNKKMNFKELFDVYRKDYIVVTFLAILSMAKKQEIEIKQDNNFNDIYLSLKENGHE